ncbi:hypothetical protein ThimaDRAFT_4276 [Thiocapsa marina 5811]|uniref:Uncharacterized protein n=1 Tax=Thiocapsa marina 5811 TaxID=768671 RepID=F9UH09_9GAMM|nr:hypothetical protein ThimaDRAFT_4276 [Thiocapsa marina 5811]
MDSENRRRPLDTRPRRPLAGDTCADIPAPAASADTARPRRATPCDNTSDPTPAAHDASSVKTDFRDQPRRSTGFTLERPSAASIASNCDKFVIVSIEREPERHAETPGLRAMRRTHEGASTALDVPKIQPLNMAPILRGLKQRTLLSTREQKT